MLLGVRVEHVSEERKERGMEEDKLASVRDGREGGRGIEDEEARGRTELTRPTFVVSGSKCVQADLCCKKKKDMDEDMVGKRRRRG